MPQIPAHVSLHDQIESLVDDVESRTSAEIVVVLSPRSGTYRDVDLKSGIGLAAIALIVMLMIPIAIPELWAVGICTLALMVGSFLANRVDPLRRFLCTARRRRSQVAEAAKLQFVDNGVSATAARTGVLIYSSRFEGRIEVLPDLGIEGRVPAAKWNHILDQLDEHGSTALIAVIEQCGAVLADAFPGTADDGQELSNRPRIQP